MYDELKKIISDRTQPEGKLKTDFDYKAFIEALKYSTKEEINKYYDKLNKEHKEHMKNDNKYYGSGKQSKCLSCCSGEVKKGLITLGGIPTYIIKCKKLCYVFQINWDENNEECNE